MTQFKVSVIINQPVDIITKALMNPENFPFWDTNLERFEVIKGEPGLVGSIGHLHYSQKGRKYIMEDELIFCDPGKRYVSRVTGDAVIARVETTLNSSGNRTEMEITWSGKGKVFLLKLLLPLLRGKMIKQAKAQLDTFKKLVETQGMVFKKMPGEE